MTVCDWTYEIAPSAARVDFRPDTEDEVIRRLRRFHRFNELPMRRMPEIWHRKVPIRTVGQRSSNLRNLSNLRILFSDFELNSLSLPSPYDVVAALRIPS